VVDERALARGIALVHRADLRNRDVRLVDDEQEVVGEEVEQRVRRLARLASVDVTRVVLDARAEAELLQHLEVERRAHAQALRLEQLALPSSSASRSPSSVSIVPIARWTVSVPAT
jgi:hypothetical protein